MPLRPGTRLGPYEIVAPTGAGGMGEVYRARDTRLDRTVAIKVVADALAADPQLRERFEREARAVSQLNHPHVCALYDVGRAPVGEGGSATGEREADYIVLEYLEGETLGARLARGPLPIKEALALAIQIADALAAAHRRGIVHRDLKPSNVMLTKSGAKLLDFGLARANAAVSTAGAATMATVDARLTEQGTILGTFQYMAPEQLEGQEADARTDLFAFGALLYEACTGRPAFEGKTRTSLIAAIVSTDPPPLSQVQPLSPLALEHVVQKCLRKDPDERWQSASDVADELRWITGAGSQAGVAAPVSAQRRRRERTAWTTAGAAALALAAAAGLLLTRSSVEPRVYSFAVPMADTGYMDASGALISPDGRLLAFTARVAEGTRQQLFVRPVDSFVARPLEGTENAGVFTWAQDSRTLVFNVAGAVKICDALGSPSTRVVVQSEEAGPSVMNRDGVILIGGGRNDGIRQVSKDGTIQSLTTPNKARHEVWHGFPTFLPDGRQFIFISFVRDPTQREQPHYLYAGSLGSPATKFLGEIPSAVAYAEPGHLLFVRDGTLTAAPFDASALDFRGDPQPLAEGIFYFKPTGRADFSVSTTGVLTYRAPILASSITWLDRTGHAAGTVGPAGTAGAFRVAPGAGEAVAQVLNPKFGTPDLWVYGLRRPTAARLTFSSGYESDPLLAPDGGRLFYSSDLVGVPDIFVKVIGSAEDDRPVVLNDGEQYPNDVSPDGKLLLYQSNDHMSDTQWDLFVVPTDGSEEPSPVVRRPFAETNGRFSPDGRRVAYQSNESGQPQVYVQPFPGPGRARQVSTAGGVMPRWSADGRQLYFRRGRALYVADLGSEAEPSLVLQTDRSFGTFEVIGNGERFLTLMDRGGSESQVPTRVIVNWPELLKGPRRD